MDMFSFDDSPAEKKVSGYSYPLLPEYPMKDILRMEKELMGVCFSGNLLATYKTHVAKLNPDKLSDIAGGVSSIL